MPDCACPFPEMNGPPFSALSPTKLLRYQLPIATELSPNMVDEMLVKGFKLLEQLLFWLSTSNNKSTQTVQSLTRVLSVVT